MPRLIMFNVVSLDGYFTSCNRRHVLGSTGMTRNGSAFVRRQRQCDAALAFGRKNLRLDGQLLADAIGGEESSWRSRSDEPVPPKVVFSRTLDKAEWKHHENWSKVTWQRKFADEARTR